MKKTVSGVLLHGSTTFLALESISSSCSLPLSGKVWLKYSSKVYIPVLRIASLKHFDEEFKKTLFDNSDVDLVLDT